VTEGNETVRRAFEAFARAETDALLRSAFLLTGDRHHAEDLVQTALAQVATRWRKIEDPAAYVRRRSRVVEKLTADLVPAENTSALVRTRSGGHGDHGCCA
jgi:DNA-directed RNA polymerase specialized sigma24 family protein